VVSVNIVHFLRPGILMQSLSVELAGHNKNLWPTLGN
jgi:hypothetical protein